MCARPEEIIDYRSLTPDEWQRARQQILTRAQAARARAMRELGSALLHPWQTVLATVRAYARWRERRAAVRELHALDDRSLRDIGVSRSEIEWVGLEPAGGARAGGGQGSAPLPALAGAGHKHTRQAAACGQRTDRQTRGLECARRRPADLGRPEVGG
jgi:uncharacterized protein YjiS (DUF1127 family)